MLSTARRATTMKPNKSQILTLDISIIISTKIFTYI